MNERTHFFIKIYLSHFILERVMFLWCVIDGWRDISQREDFFFSYLLPGARGCQCLHPLQARQRCLWSVACPTLDCDSLHLFKSDRVVLITWSSSGYTPVWPECPDAPSSFCLLIKIWQLTKAHEVTWNEPKIHVICYITQCIYFQFFLWWCTLHLRHNHACLSGNVVLHVFVLIHRLDSVSLVIKFKVKRPSWLFNLLFLAVCAVQ